MAAGDTLTLHTVSFPQRQYFTTYHDHRVILDR